MVRTLIVRVAEEVDEDARVRHGRDDVVVRDGERLLNSAGGEPLCNGTRALLRNTYTDTKTQTQTQSTDIRQSV